MAVDGNDKGCGGSIRGQKKQQTLPNEAIEYACVCACKRSADSHLLIGGRCDWSSTRRSAATNESPYLDLGSPAC